MFTRLRTTISECYAFREVLFNILSQDLKVKYKRTFLGYLWSLLNPVLQLAVLTAVFSHVVRLGMKDYTLYLFSGLLVWTFFQTTTTAASTALLENENFIKKVYLPKMLFPLSKLCLKAIDFVFSLVALSVIGAVLGFHFHATVIYLPAAILIFFTFTLGMAISLSILTVFFRDIQYLLNVFLQLLYFLTPIIYPISALPDEYRRYLNLNPLVPEILLFQKLIYYGEFPTGMEWGVAAGLALVSIAIGWILLNLFEEDLVFRM